MASNENSCSNWARVSVLGSGGFGIVTLWKNKLDSRMIALKMCRDGTENFISTKHKERWAKEVEIMQRLSHPNVVKAIEIPDELLKLQSELPILCMEYCSKGDLRKVLNCPENCSGLQEPEIRNLLRDVKSAIEFLHKHKIIHRDLKPENIVLQELPNDCVVYKLIDLGYAKELDQNSLCSSFVGTLQYLAPELFTPQGYTCSVDYWSFGLVCHEIITGFRPFLPNMTPVSWMTHVQKKTSEDICIYQNADGSIEYSQQLFAENHISQCLRYEFEKWLCMALEWDGNKRGRAPDNSLVIFSSLDVILNKKIVTVFSVVAYEKLSYEVDSSTAIATLQLWIERDTKQPINEQLLLLPSGEKLMNDTLAHQCWDPTLQEAMVYVFSIRGLELPSVPPKLPPLVVRMLEAPKSLQPYFYLRRAWPSAVYFLHSQLSLYQTFLEAYAVKMLSIIIQNLELTKADQAVTNDIQQILAKQKLNSDSSEYDIKCFNKIHLDEKEKSMVSEWQEKIKLCEKKVHQLTELGEKLGSKVSGVAKRLASVQSYQEPGQYYIERLKALLEVGQKTFENLRRWPNDAKEKKSTSVDMVKVVYNCLKERDRMLRDQPFASHLVDVNNCEMEINSLLPPMNALRQHIAKCNNDITRCQLLRQKDIWQLVFNFKSISGQNHESVQSTNLSITNMENSAVHAKAQQFNPYSKINLENKKTVSAVLLDNSNSSAPGNSVPKKVEVPLLVVAPCNVEQKNGSNDQIINENLVPRKLFDHTLDFLTDDTKEMIYANQNLRYALQDCMTQSYQKYQNIIAESETFDKEFSSLLKK